MSIYFFYEDVTLPTLNFEFIKELFNSEIKEGKFKLGIINFIFCSDNYLLEINKKFLQHDYFTDVISFDYSESNFVSGDVYISTESVLSNSIIFNQRFTDELVRVISHGFFHLLTYNDKEEDEIKVMRQKETEMIDRYNSVI